MSIIDSLTSIISAKSSIKNSIINKGVEVDESAKLADYAVLIDSIAPKIYQGTLTTDENGYTYVDTGFSPDVVYIESGFIYEEFDTAGIACTDFNAMQVLSQEMPGSLCFCPMNDGSDFISFSISRDSTGFTLYSHETTSGAGYAAEMKYAAIKYT